MDEAVLQDCDNALRTLAFTVDLLKDKGIADIVVISALAQTLCDQLVKSPHCDLDNVVAILNAILQDFSRHQVRREVVH